jgi:hypothetical protein
MAFQRPVSLGANPHHFIRNASIVGTFMRADDGERAVVTGIDRWGMACKMKVVTRSYIRYNPAQQERKDKIVAKWNAELAKKDETGERRKSNVHVQYYNGVKYTIKKALKYAL